jgi:hypothetical protein
VIETLYASVADVAVAGPFCPDHLALGTEMVGVVYLDYLQELYLFFCLQVARLGAPTE